MLEFVYNWFLLFLAHIQQKLIFLESVKVFYSGSNIKAFACQIRIPLFNFVFSKHWIKHNMDNMKWTYIQLYSRHVD